MGFIRINKYLSTIGVCSRRQVDALINQRRITINNRIAVLGQKVDPEVDTVVVDRKIIRPQPVTKVYYLLHKPKFVLSTTVDTHDRPTVLDYVPHSTRLYPVGRLDYESTGLIILTNDGDFALRLTHPRYHLPKTYQVTVVGKLTPDKIRQLTKGIRLEDGLTAPAKVNNVNTNQFGRIHFDITIYEGRKRQIRRMCSALSLHVEDLKRISVGDLTLGDLPIGKYRLLTASEVRSLLDPHLSR